MVAIITRTLAAFAAWCVVTTAAAMYGGLYFISYLINDSRVHWIPNQVNLRLGSYAMLVALGVAGISLGIRVMWAEAKTMLVVLIISSVLTSGYTAEGINAFFHLMAAGQGWNNSELGGFTTAVVMWGCATAGLSFGAVSDADTGADNAGQKTVQQHTIHLDLGRPDYTAYAYLRPAWIARRILEGLMYGATLSVIRLWVAQTTGVSYEVKLIWTCLVLGAVIGPIAGIAMACLRFSYLGLYARLGVETAAVALAGSAGTPWVWLALILSVAGAVVGAQRRIAR